MNIVFWLLVVTIAIILWLLLAFIFYPLGKFVYRIFTDTTDELNRDNEKSTQEGKKEK